MPVLCLYLLITGVWATCQALSDTYVNQNWNVVWVGSCLETTSWKLWTTVKTSWKSCTSRFLFQNQWIFLFPSLLFYCCLTSHKTCCDTRVSMFAYLCSMFLPLKMGSSVVCKTVLKSSNTSTLSPNNSVKHTSSSSNPLCSVLILS